MSSELPEEHPTTVAEALDRFFISTDTPKEEQMFPPARKLLSNAFYAGAISALRLITDDLKKVIDRTLVKTVMDEILLAVDDPNYRIYSAGPKKNLAFHAARFIQDKERAHPEVMNQRLKFFYGGAASLLSLLNEGPHRQVQIVEDLRNYAAMARSGEAPEGKPS